MRFPRYWAKGNSPASAEAARGACCWRWSDVSLADAQRQANDRAAELGRLFAAGTPLNRYGYGDGTLREEVIQTVAKDAAADTAVITRNAYGALVLNTSTAMFIDIDFPPGKASVGGLFRRLMGGPAPARPEDVALQKIQTWSADHPQIGMRVYRTCAGMRCLVTSRTFDPKQSETFDVLQSIGSDPLYIRLCKAQSCFRARLTPKPWRCGIPIPPSRYPRPDQAAEAKFRQWQTKYDRAIAGHSVCQFVQQIGPAQTHPELRAIVEVHDHHTQLQANGPLA